MTGGHTALEPVRKTISVACDVEHAFRAFTEGIDTWWPVETHSITGGRDGSDPPQRVVFESAAGGRLYEQTRDGRECDWATILVYEPPRRIVLEWRVNPAAPPTEVEVRFEPDGEATRVDLEHRGWKQYAAGGEEARSSYDSGWPGVLDRYRSTASEPS